VRTCQIVNLAYEAGGAERSVRLIRDSLAARGHPTLVIATDATLGDAQPFADVIVPAISGSAPHRVAGYLWNRDALRRVRDAVQSFRPDVVHLHTIGEFSPSVAAAVRDVPTLLTVHGPEDYTLGLLPWQLSSSAYRNASYEWSDLTMHGRATYGYLRFLQRPAYRLALRGASRILAPSAFIARELRKDFVAARIHQLYNGIALPDRQAPRPGGPILYVGRLEAVKGVDVLLEALALLARRGLAVRLRIVGDGSQRPALEALGSRLGIAELVEFTGWLGEPEVEDEIAAAALVAIPSVWPENLPTVAIESLAIGRPLVASAVGGMPELVTDGVNGRLVPSRDPGALADAIAWVLADEVRARGLAAASRERAGTFAVDTFVDSLERHYRAVAA
jgi:glycosyltransferase involved in cell wall biosynthesis